MFIHCLWYIMLLCSYHHLRSCWSIFSTLQQKSHPYCECEQKISLSVLGMDENVFPWTWKRTYLFKLNYIGQYIQQQIEVTPVMIMNAIHLTHIYLALIDSLVLTWVLENVFYYSISDPSRKCVNQVEKNGSITYVSTDQENDANKVFIISLKLRKVKQFKLVIW